MMRCTIVCEMSRKVSRTGTKAAGGHGGTLPPKGGSVPTTDVPHVPLKVSRKVSRSMSRYVDA